MPRTSRGLIRCGTPASPDDLTGGKHDCLNLRFPGATEFRWPLQTAERLIPGGELLLHEVDLAAGLPDRGKQGEALPDLAALSWDTIADRTLAVYRGRAA